MANGLGCGIERTATEQKMAFHSIVRNVLGAEDEHTDDVLLDLQQNLSDMIDEYAETHDDDEDVFLLDKEVVTKLLADSEISEEKAAKIEKSVDEAFGEKPPAAENVIDSKALVQNELRVEKMALEDQVGTLTVQLNEKDEALAERTSQLIEKQEEIDNYKNNGQVVMPGAKPGDLKFKDLNGDGKLDDEDRTMTGNPHPDFTFGLTLSAEYKGFDVSAFFQGSVGNDLLNVLKYDIYSGTGWYNAPKDILTTYWNGPGSTNKNFGIDADSRMNLEMSDWYVENGSYVRLKNLQIGYTIPSAITKKITINNLRIFVAAQNLFTITGYSGLDPEIGEINNNPQYKGCDMGFYPQPRTFMFGISLKL